jgi:hypothetical protein
MEEILGLESISRARNDKPRQVNPPLKFARVAGVSLIMLKFSLQLFNASKKALHVVFVGNPLLELSSA